VFVRPPRLGRSKGATSLSWVLTQVKTTITASTASTASTAITAMTAVQLSDVFRQQHCHSLSSNERPADSHGPHHPDKGPPLLFHRDVISAPESLAFLVHLVSPT
jgi:hypothetical protein